MKDQPPPSGQQPMSERAKRTSRTRKRDWKPDFLASFAKTGLVSYACEDAGIGRTTAYQARQRDEAFALAWADTEQQVTETMERELFRRAVEGVDKPVYQGGKRVGTIREYSDTLLIVGLKARAPDRYRENFKVEHTGNVGLDLAGMSEADLEALADGLSARRG